ncbi:MAG: hypothetical protein ACFFD7_00300 [Candidatus Thorarchaeota archaeon]
MDLEKDYEKLYQHWLKEFQQKDLTVLTQKILENYKKILNNLNNHHEDSENPLRFQIHESFKKNIDYLFNDLLQIRELKIKNAALALKDIELDNVIEAEKLLYQNLVSSIKGYQKVKAVSIFQDEEVLKPEATLKTEQAKTTTYEVSGEMFKEKEPEIFLVKEKEPEEQINYTLLRFLKETPPLVGIDLLNYGPFEKEDIAFIPTENANILIFEKFAEKIEVS